MVRFFSFLISFLFTVVSYAADNNYQIKVTLKNYQHSKLFLAYYLGGKTYIKDTSEVKNNIALFKGQEVLEKGMYLLVEEVTNNYALLLVDDHTQNISIELDFKKTDEMKITGSTASSEFVSYLKLLNAKRAQKDSLLKLLSQAGTAERKKEIQRQADGIDTWVKQYQKNYVRQNSTSLLSLIIKINLEYEPPVFSGTENEKKDKEYRWYKQHWFDNTSMADPRMLRTNLLSEKIDYYLDKLTVQDPDSIINSVDEVLGLVKPSPETYKYMLIDLLNKYARSNIVGMDAVYVHIALKYYAKGKAPWTDTDQLKKILDNARRLEPLLIGNKTPDLELMTLDGTKTSIWTLDAKFTVLFFLGHDCSYCKKWIPGLLEAEKQLRDKGVKVLTVFTDKNLNEAEECRKFVNSNAMNSFLNTIDNNYEGNAKIKYDISTIPQIFILDENKIIRSKKIGGEQVKEVLEYYLSK